MKIAIDRSPLISGDKVRGVGFQTKGFLDAFGKLKNTGVELDVVDFTKADLSSYDIVHYLRFHPHFLTLPKTKPSKKVVVTIDDLIPLLYPEHYPPGFQGSLNLFIQKKRLKNVDAVITIAETGKRDISRFLNIKPSKIHVTHLAHRSIFRKLTNSDKSIRAVKDKFKLPGRFVLYVGDVNYNKNILGLIRACRKAGARLVIVGKQALDVESRGSDIIGVEGPRDWIRFLFNAPHPEEAHYGALLDEFNKSKKIVRTGFITDHELVAIYNLATVYVQPSFTEGFGLPILEAMACGVAVVAANNKTHLEIVKGAALFVSPNKLAPAIKKMLRSSKLRGEYIKKGSELTKKYSWKKTAKETLEVYKSVFNEKA